MVEGKIKANASFPFQLYKTGTRRGSILRKLVVTKLAGSHCDCKVAPEFCLYLVLLRASPRGPLPVPLAPLPQVIFRCLPSLRLTVSHVQGRTISLESSQHELATPSGREEVLGLRLPMSVARFIFLTVSVDSQIPVWDWQMFSPKCHCSECMILSPNLGSQASFC